MRLRYQQSSRRRTSTSCRSSSRSLTIGTPNRTTLAASPRPARGPRPHRQSSRVASRARSSSKRSAARSWSLSPSLPSKYTSSHLRVTTPQLRHRLHLAVAGHPPYPVARRTLIGPHSRTWRCAQKPVYRWATSRRKATWRITSACFRKRRVSSRTQ